MKKVLLIMALLFSVVPLFSQGTDSAYISLRPAEFREEMEIVGNPVVIDVREFFEYKRKRLNGAINIPSSGSIDSAADTLNKASHLFLYCTGGTRSQRVAKRFAEKGFIHLYSLDGGIKEWRMEGFPVDRKRIKKSSVTQRFTEKHRVSQR